MYVERIELYELGVQQKCNFVFPLLVCSIILRGPFLFSALHKYFVESNCSHNGTDTSISCSRSSYSHKCECQSHRGGSQCSSKSNSYNRIRSCGWIRNYSCLSCDFDSYSFQLSWYTLCSTANWDSAICTSSNTNGLADAFTSYETASILL